MHPVEHLEPVSGSDAVQRGLPGRIHLDTADRAVRPAAMRAFGAGRERGADAADESQRGVGAFRCAAFQLAGQPFMAISAGPLFKFNPSISFHIKCATVEEVEAVWARLAPDGTVLMELGEYPFSQRYGWIADRYGVSWQVVPRELPELLKDPRRANAVMKELLKMKKLDLDRLKEAYEHG